MGASAQLVQEQQPPVSLVVAVDGAAAAAALTSDMLLHLTHFAAFILSFTAPPFPHFFHTLLCWSTSSPQRPGMSQLR